MTEQLIETMNKGGTGMKDLLGKKKDTKFLDDSILDLVEADKKGKSVRGPKDEGGARGATKR